MTVEWKTTATFQAELYASVRGSIRFGTESVKMNAPAVNLSYLRPLGFVRHSIIRQIIGPSHSDILD